MARIFGENAKNEAVQDENVTSLTKAFGREAVAHLSIDLQKGYCDPDSVSKYSAQGQFVNDTEKAAKATAAFSKAIRNKIPQIWVAHNVMIEKMFPTFRGLSRQKADAGQKMARTSLHLVEPANDDTVICKQNFDAFEGTTLGDEISKRNISALLISGVMLEHCVRATVVSAIKKDLDVFLLKDLVDSDSRYGLDKYRFKSLERDGARVITSQQVLDIITP
jgi:nicotinamidase-related amidase